MKKHMGFILSVLLTAVLFAAAEEPDEARIYSKDKFNRLRAGTNAFPDSELVYHSIPEQFVGYKVTLRRFESPDPVKFKVKTPGLVRLLAQGTLLRTLTSQGWEQIGEVTLADSNGSEKPVRIYVLSKQHDVGEYSIPSEGNFGIRLLVK